MRILQISSARNIGGGERHFTDLANCLARRGHDVFAALVKGSPLVKPLIDVPRENILELRLRNALDASSALRLGRFMGKRGIQIAHAHVARDYPVAALAARTAGDVPLVITRHLLRPVNRIHRFTLNRVARVIAPTEENARFLREQNIFSEAKISVVIPGIDLEAFQQSSFNDVTNRQELDSKTRLLVGTAGELREHKGQDVFLRAAALIAKRFNDVHFLIAGEDNSPAKEYHAHLRRLVAELKLEQRVRFLGWLESMAPFYRSLDIFVSSSRDELFGMAMVEAMACGTPVVATATHGALEIINDGVTGRLVPIDNVDALASAIVALLEDEQERRRIAELGRIAARDRFSLDRMVDDTERIYRDVLGGRINQ